MLTLLRPFRALGPVPSAPLGVALLLALTSGCAARPPVAAPAVAPVAAVAPAADPHAHHQGHDMGGLPPVVIPRGALITEADVRFMQMMIAHHAQAVVMTQLAEGAGASPRVLKLAQKIDLSQAGEITLMQEWLREYEQFVPDTSSWRTMQMAGMLTEAQMSQLAAARGRAFDESFLRLMIQHHEGAISMVADLLQSPRAAQEVDISVLANEIETAQRAEIGLMWAMIADLD